MWAAHRRVASSSSPFSIGGDDVAVRHDAALPVVGVVPLQDPADERGARDRDSSMESRALPEAASTAAWKSSLHCAASLRRRPRRARARSGPAARAAQRRRPVRPPGREPRPVSLDQRTQPVGLVDVFRCPVDDRLPGSARARRTLGREQPQRLAHRGAAQPERRGDGVLAQPFAGTSARGDPFPDGVVGQLRVRGAGVVGRAEACSCSRQSSQPPRLCCSDHIACNPPCHRQVSALCGID